MNLLENINKNKLPRHLAIIMDGNGRWAHARLLPRTAGHAKGVQSVRRAVETCGAAGVKYLTLFAFSSENWRRPADEVSGLMELLSIALQREVPSLSDNGVRLHFPGDRAGLSSRVIQGLEAAERNTAHNDRLVLNVCFNYGGRWDIVQAARQLESLCKAHRAATPQS